MECDYPHIIKGRIIKERRSMSEEHRSEGGRLISTEYRDTISSIGAVGGYQPPSMFECLIVHRFVPVADIAPVAA